MIKEYGIYNNHKLDNTLLIRFSDKKENRVSKIDSEVEVLYFEDEPVGYKINNFIRYAKIRYSGIIFLPANPLIDVINSILINHKLETLDYKKGSGYITKKKDDKLYVYILEGTYLRDETISKGKYATYYDLDINIENENDLIEIQEDIPENIDFFKAEAM